MRTRVKGFLVLVQGGTFVRPSGPTAVPRSADQVGGPDSRGRRQRHGQHSAHAGHAGLRPDRQPARVRRAGDGRRGRRPGGAPGTAAGRAAAAAVRRRERQRRSRNANDRQKREWREEVMVVVVVVVAVRFPRVRCIVEQVFYSNYIEYYNLYRTRVYVFNRAGSSAQAGRLVLPVLRCVI